MQTLSVSNSKSQSTTYSLWILLLVTVLSFMLMELPVLGWLLTPVTIFVTTLHEMGHAIACLLTGGSVHGLTIVGDGQGHGGLTFTSGGIPWIIDSAGYLGAALFGCMFLWLGQIPSRAKNTLIALGTLIAIASVAFMTQAIFINGGFSQGAESVITGLVMAAVLIAAGTKLRPQYAHFILLFLAVQTALNALTDIKFLVELSLGFYHTASFSDATNMAAVTGLPAAFWSIVWGVTALLMLVTTLRLTYFKKGSESPSTL